MKNIAINDIKQSCYQWRMWLTLGWQDIKIRYKRSIIGPFWLTISMAVTIYTMGFLYGRLFGSDLNTYFPSLATGLIGWTFISALLTESANIFIEAEDYIKNAAMPYSLFLMRMVVRNFIIFCHNIVVFIPMYFVFDTQFNLHALLIIPGIVVIALNAVFWGGLIAIIGTRFRDFSQIIASIVQVSFFLTPVIWQPNQIPPENQWFIHYNPFYHFLSLLRNPLIDMSIHHSLLVATLIAFIGFLLFSFVMNRYKRKIVFWL